MQLFFGNGKCELIQIFSTTMVTHEEGRHGKCEKRNEKCKFFARESVKLKWEDGWPGYDIVVHEKS